MVLRAENGTRRRQTSKNADASPDRPVCTSAPSYAAMMEARSRASTTGCATRDFFIGFLEKSWRAVVACINHALNGAASSSTRILSVVDSGLSATRRFVQQSMSRAEVVRGVPSCDRSTCCPKTFLMNSRLDFRPDHVGPRPETSLATPLLLAHLEMPSELASSRVKISNQHFF